MNIFLRGIYYIFFLQRVKPQQPVYLQNQKQKNHILQAYDYRKTTVAQWEYIAPFVVHILSGLYCLWHMLPNKEKELMQNTRIEITFYWNDDKKKNLETRDAMIGVWDGESDDDDVFYWFDNDGSELIGSHNDEFTVVSVKMDPVKVKTGDVVFTRSYQDLLRSFETNEHRELVFDSVDLSARMLKVLKKSRDFVISDIDEDGDIRFLGHSGTFPKECVQNIVGGVA